MSQKKGELNRQRFSVWVSEMKSKDQPNWEDYFYSGSLSKSKVARELGFHKDGFKPQRNEKLANMFDSLNRELAIDGVYSKRKLSIPLEKEVIRTAAYAAEGVKDSAKVRDLKRINQRLQTENAKLLGEMAKLLEMKEVLQEMGLYK